MTLQRKYFTAWQLYLTQTQQLSIIEERRKLTENKMASFLDAAATGKLWSRRNGGADLRRSRSFEAVNQSKDSTNLRVVSMRIFRSRAELKLCAYIHKFLVVFALRLLLLWSFPYLGAAHQGFFFNLVLLLSVFPSHFCIFV